jgi:hypothetical protein
MRNRWMAVVLGAAVLAIPGTAVAKGDHGKGKGHEKTHKVEKKAKHEKKAKKAKKPKSFVFRGVYKADGVVTVVSGNSRVRKGGYVGQDVTFDLSAAKLIVADTDGVPGVTAADVQAGDVVLVQARLPRVPEEAPAAIKARKLIDFTHPPVSVDEEAEPAAPEVAPAS